MEKAASPKRISKITPDEIDLRQLFGTLIDSKYTIICTTIVFAVVGVMVALLSTPIYRADALIQVEEQSGGVSALTGELGDIFSGESSAVTEIEVIKSRMVVGETVNQLGLTNQASPVYFPVVGEGLNRLFGTPRVIQVELLEVPSQLIAKPLNLIATSSSSYELYDEHSVLLLSGNVGEVAIEGDISMLVSELSAESGDRFTVTKQYWLEAVRELQQSLSVSERGKQSGVLSLSLEGANPLNIQRILQSISDNYVAQNVAREAAQAQSSLDFLEAQLPDIRNQLQGSENRLNSYRQQRESVDLSREAQALLDSIVELESRLSDLSFEEAEISQRFTPQHPAYRTLLENRETLMAQRAELDRRIRSLPETQREILSRTRELEVNQQVYTTLLNRVQELTVVRAGTVGFVRIVDSATTALRPVKPKKPLIAVLATLLGGMLGVAIVLVRSFMNPGLRSTEGVEDIGLPVYGNIPFSEDEAKLKSVKSSRRKTFQPLALRNPADISVEAIRALRTSIHFAQMDATNNVVMISGAAPGAGKSFLASNLAVSLAASEQRVLLIDADMRRGHLHREFGLHKQDGLADYLQGEQSEIANVISNTALENLQLVTLGTSRPPNPSELLMHDRFKQLIDWASGEYDVVLVDTPPVLAVTDAEVIARLSGVNLLVGRFEQITLKEIERAVHRFDKSGIKMHAFILNAVARTRRASYDYGYYHYDYANSQ